MEPAVIAALLGAAGVVIAALLSFHAGRSVSKANAFNINATTLVMLSDKVNALSEEVIKLRNEVDDLSDKNRVLWAYTYQLLDQLRKHKIKPVTPPDELMDDPKLATLLKWINE